MTIAFTSRVVVPGHVLVQQVAGEAVLLNLQSERYFGLDGVGTRMWNLITTSDSIQSAYEALLSEYEVDADQLRRDVQNLVGNLLENGLLEAAHE